MRVAVLTSSRADYGIYQPLLRKFTKESVEFELIVFGTHLSEFHGLTYKQILEDGYTIRRKIESLVLGDSSEAISSAMALTAAKFSGVWASLEGEYDIVFCLGDRYEMFAAVSAAVPFDITFAHIHGGEETLGAIDNIFRHSITQMADYHFTSTEEYKSRVLNLIGRSEKENETVFNVGALSLDNLLDIELLSTDQLLDEYGIDLAKPSILFTFHPETNSPDTNEGNIKKILQVLEQLQEYQIIITMPNADTSSNVIRHELAGFISENEERVFAIESFGTRGYFSCMQNVDFVMGNSSSGIIEAASFGKYAIDLGDRQKGRTKGKNVISIGIDQQQMLSAVAQIKESPKPPQDNIYWQGELLKKSFKC